MKNSRNTFITKFAILMLVLIFNTIKHLGKHPKLVIVVEEIPFYHPVLMLPSCFSMMGDWL